MNAAVKLLPTSEGCVHPAIDLAMKETRKITHEIECKRKEIVTLERRLTEERAELKRYEEEVRLLSEFLDSQLGAPSPADPPDHHPV